MFISIIAHSIFEKQFPLGSEKVSEKLPEKTMRLWSWLKPYQQPSGPICVHQRPQMALARFCKDFAWENNGLRHSFVSYRLAILHDMARVALEAGNSQEVIFAHYRKLVTAKAAKMWLSVKPS